MRVLLTLMRLALLAFAVTFSTAADAAAQVSSPDSTLIRRIRAEQNHALATGDLDRAAGHWTSNVMVTAGLGVVVEGREAYRRAFEQESGLIYRREPVQIEVSPDFPIAWETGDWTGHRVGGDGTPVILGRYSAQWIRIGGRWLIRSELFVALRCDGDACKWPVATH